MKDKRKLLTVLAVISVVIVFGYLQTRDTCRIENCYQMTFSVNAVILKRDRSNGSTEVTRDNPKLWFDKRTVIEDVDETNDYDSTEEGAYLVKRRTHFKSFWHSGDRCNKQLPKCLIIGVQKCGTKALAEFLSIHPEIALNSKQTYYFSSNYSLGLDWYKGQLPCSQEDQTTIERTPQYLYFKVTLRRVYAMNPNMKLLLIVKNPLDRTLSNFAMAKYRNRVPESKKLEHAIFVRNSSGLFVRPDVKFIDKSRYAKYVTRWLKVFPRHQLHIIDGETFQRNPAQELAKIESFLGLKHYIEPKHFVYNSDSGFYCLNIPKYSSEDASLECLPKTKGREHPQLSKEGTALLREYFSKENKKFFNLVNTKFNW